VAAKLRPAAYLNLTLPGAADASPSLAAKQQTSARDAVAMNVQPSSLG
jgi:hypothetical protein